MLSKALAAGAAALAATCLGTAALAANPEAAEEHLRFDWYRIEVAVFRRGGDEPLGVARPRLLDAFRMPRFAAPLVEQTPPNAGWSMGERPPLAADAPVLVSDLPPPAWFGGPCAGPRWLPSRRGPARDPCLWHAPPDADLERYLPDEPSSPWRIPNLPPDALANPSPAEEPTPPDLRAELLERLAEAFTAHEQQLFETSYEWQLSTPGLATVLPRLRRRFDVLAAGSWHQPVPAREQPFPLLVQLGEAESAAPFVLEGSFGVTLGRYLHFEARLLLRLAPDTTALLAEKRRMRSEELHYLDHPAFGLLVYATPVELPEDLLALLEDLAALDDA